MTNSESRVTRSRAAQLRQARIDADGMATVRARRSAEMLRVVTMISRNGNRVDRSESLSLHIARDNGLVLILDSGEWGYEVELTEKALDI